MGDFLSMFRSTTGNLKAKLKELSAAIERAKRRREELEQLPPPVDEIAANLDRHVHSRVEEFYAYHLQRRVRALEQGASQGSMVLFNGNQVSGQELECMLAYFFPEQLRAGLKRAAADALRDHKVGPAKAEREKELAQLEARVADLEKEREGVRTELDAMRSELQ